MILRGRREGYSQTARPTSAASTTARDPIRRSSTSSTGGASTTANGESNGATGRRAACAGRPERRARPELALPGETRPADVRPRGVRPGPALLLRSGSSHRSRRRSSPRPRLAGSIVWWQARRGRGGGLAVVTLIFLVIQAAVGLASQSATVYLAQPVVLSAGWGVAHLVSVAVGRPLVGVFANLWYPFPPEFRASVPYRREFGLQSVVWGVYCLARAGVRLAVLLGSGVGGFVLVSLLTGPPVLFALVFWGIWHARRSFLALEASRESGPMKRTGPLRSRLMLRALRSGVVVWRLCERLGIDLVGATEGPPIGTDRARRAAFEELIAAARAGDGTIDAAACPHPRARAADAPRRRASACFCTARTTPRWRYSSHGRPTTSTPSCRPSWRATTASGRSSMR